MPVCVFYAVCFVLAAGILIGSFCDYRISEVLSRKTGLGRFHESYSNILSHLMYPVAGMCLFKGLRKKGKRFHTLAWGVLGFSLFWTFYSFLDTSGKHLRAALGYVPGQPGSLPILALCFLIWAAVAGLTAFLAYLIIDDEKADMLIAIGSVILTAGIFSKLLVTWLKIIGCRPRFRYLITLDDPAGRYRNWWQMIPYLKDESSYRSWPSGHMTKATIMLTLPMLADVLKCRKGGLRYLLFAFAVLWIAGMGYNRIHMNAHFLADVCFGVLIAYCLYALVFKLVFSVFQNEDPGSQ